MGRPINKKFLQNCTVDSSEFNLTGLALFTGVEHKVRILQQKKTDVFVIQSCTDSQLQKTAKLTTFENLSEDTFYIAVDRGPDYSAEHASKITNTRVYTFEGNSYSWDELSFSEPASETNIRIGDRRIIRRNFPELFAFLNGDNDIIAEPKWVLLAEYDPETETMTELSSINDFALPYQGAAVITPDGRYIIAGGLPHPNLETEVNDLEDKRSLGMYRNDNGTLVEVFRYSPPSNENTYAGILNLNISPDGKYVGVSYATTSFTSPVFPSSFIVYEIGNDELIPLENNQIASGGRQCIFTKDSSHVIVSAGNDIDVYKIDKKNRTTTRTQNFTSSNFHWVNAFGFNKAENRLVGAALNGMVFLLSFDKNLGRVTQLDSVQTFGGFLWDAKFSPNDDYVIIGGRENPELMSRPILNGREFGDQISGLPVSSRVFDIVFIGNGEQMIVSGTNGRAWLYNFNNNTGEIELVQQVCDFPGQNTHIARANVDTARLITEEIPDV